MYPLRGTARDKAIALVPVGPVFGGWRSSAGGQELGVIVGRVSFASGIQMRADAFPESNLVKVKNTFLWPASPIGTAEVSRPSRPRLEAPVL